MQSVFRMAFPRQHLSVAFLTRCILHVPPTTSSIGDSSLRGSCGFLHLVCVSSADHLLPLRTFTFLPTNIALAALHH